MAEKDILMKFCQLKNQKEPNSDLILSKDPLADYKYSDKRTLETNNFYDQKVQKNREREEKILEEE